jgi:hypothetical protein
LDEEWRSLPNCRSVEFAPTREGILDGCRFLFDSARNSRGRRRFNSSFVILFLCAGLFLVWSLLKSNGPNGGKGAFDLFGIVLISMAVIFLAFLLLFPLVFNAVFNRRGRMERTVEKAIADPEMAMLAERRITIAPKGCLVEFPKGRQVYAWALTNRPASIDGQCLLVTENNVIFAFLARRAFDSESSFQDFVDACRAFQQDATRPAGPPAGDQQVA